MGGLGGGATPGKQKVNTLLGLPTEAEALCMHVALRCATLWQVKLLQEMLAMCRYSLRLIKISYVNLWVQPANCEFIEANPPNPLRSYWINYSNMTTCVKSDLEQFQHHN